MLHLQHRPGGPLDVAPATWTGRATRCCTCNTGRAGHSMLRLQHGPGGPLDVAPATQAGRATRCCTCNMDWAGHSMLHLHHGPGGPLGVAPATWTGGLPPAIAGRPERRGQINRGTVHQSRASHQVRSSKNVMVCIGWDLLPPPNVEGSDETERRLTPTIVSIFGHSFRLWHRASAGSPSPTSRMGFDAILVAFLCATVTR